jgi:hypothetical protein
VFFRPEDEHATSGKADILPPVPSGHGEMDYAL